MEGSRKLYLTGAILVTILFPFLEVLADNWRVRMGKDRRLVSGVIGGLSFLIPRNSEKLFEHRVRKGMKKGSFSADSVFVGGPKGIAL